MNRRVIGIVLALVLAVVGTGAVLLYVNIASGQVAAGQQAVRVLVAKDRIAAGTTGKRIRDADLTEEVVMPRSSLPLDALGSVAGDLDELVINNDVQPRGLLLRGAFVAKERISGGLSVPEKMLGVSLKLAVEEEVGGFIRPGSQIAVFGTYALADKAYKDATGQDNKNTTLLLPRTEVLAVGAYGDDGVTSAAEQKARDTGTQRDGDGKVTLLVTVSVNQADAERLIHSTRIGALYAALLSDSTQVRPGAGVTNRSVLR